VTCATQRNWRGGGGGGGGGGNSSSSRCQPKSLPSNLTLSHTPPTPPPPMSCEPGGLSFTLNSGHSIPAVGLGVYQAAHGDEAYEACLNALRMGYRHIDTAQIYRNEASVGKAIKDSGIPRENIFVTTKFWSGGGHGRTNAVDALKGSLALLMLSYVDLYLMHSPGKAGAGRSESWAGMEDSVKQGLARSIGVSNYGVAHLKDLKGYAKITPAVNQIELSPWRNCADIAAECKAMGILLQAYSPLTKGQKLDDPRLAAIAAKYSKTPAQILIRYGIDQVTPHPEPQTPNPKPQTPKPRPQTINRGRAGLRCPNRPPPPASRATLRFGISRLLQVWGLGFRV
jgi:diketogulonate reductase-like aldo/keto reductase